MTPRLFYRTAAIAEAITWTGLIAGILLRNLAGWDLAVLIAGSIHGLVFLSYTTTSRLGGINQPWRVPLFTVGVISANVSDTSAPLKKVMHRKGRVDGDGR